ncbi:phosphatase PAP2 family protein [Actinomycetospora endophytica]|uniref:Phosphatase PAP2 family protein n=1 Tax=Actinomycetospora endophytica TaxID=2291215 RepID=A0ABS8P3D0_9PSEU|nr:phosphatase PAP2 family protein [Actinomycetospora endophytica]MCD2192743.1 phosphatase PAP2 family protein [Actinomycetospora endophytica]
MAPRPGEARVTAGWWVVAGTAAAAVLLVAAAVGCRVRRWPGGRATTTVTAALGAAAVLTVLASVVFALVADDEALRGADGPVLAWLVGHRTPGWTGIAETVSLVGGTVGTGGLAVVTAVVLWARGRLVRAAVWAVAVLVGSLTIRSLKAAVERPRPPVDTRLTVETSASLPSGHSLMAALGLGLAVLGVLTLLGSDGGRRRAIGRAATVLVGVVLVVGIGVSRAYLGVHWTTDVLAGWLLGGALAAIALAVAVALEAWPSEIHPSEGVSPPPLR